MTEHLKRPVTQANRPGHRTKGDRVSESNVIKHVDRQYHFSSTFGIHTADGEVANTACLGFGLERATMALFKVHGFMPAKWSQEVRAHLWHSSAHAC